MSDLLMILVGLGVLIVVGVLLFNWWQERAFHQRAEQHFKPSKRDVLIEDFQVNTENMRQERSKTAQKTRIEPSLEPSSKPSVEQSLAPSLDEDLSLNNALNKAPTPFGTDKTRALDASRGQTRNLDSSTSAHVDAELEPSFTDKSSLAERHYDGLRKPSAEQLAQATTNADTTFKSDTSFKANAQPDDFSYSALSQTLTLQDDAVDAQALSAELSLTPSDLTANDLTHNDEDDRAQAFAPSKAHMPVAASGHATPAHTVQEISLPAALHAQIDLIALLYASSPLTNSTVKQLSSQLNEFVEHTCAFGLTDKDVWLELSQASASSTFSQIAYGLQLADRGGAVSRSILNRFQHMVETIGLDLSAHVEWQGNGDPLNQAMTLDQFCIEVDKTVGFHLLANAGATFHATKLRGLLEAQGLTLATDGRFHLINAEHGGLEFAIKNFEGNPLTIEMVKSSVMHGITFQLDIPTTKNSAQVFDRMVVIAKSLAKALDASMLDDNRRPLGDIQLEKIRQQLKVINAKMIAIGIIPGSQHALRLFS